MSLDPSLVEPASIRTPTPLRTWAVCGLMLLATMLNYMDRQALSQQATDVRSELKLTNEDYGNLETGFGIAFAVGGVATGFLVDQFSLRWMYPAVLLLWSAVGFATGWVTSYRELMVCRVLLGFAEAGQWPCALAASQRLLSRSNRALGNSILQSGASLGAIITPLVILGLNQPGEIGNWRLPFRVIGALGVVWVAAWLILIRPRDLELKDQDAAPTSQDDREAADVDRATRVRRFAALIVVVIAINICWQYFRAWMPMMLKKEHGYGETTIQWFSSAYYIAAGVGCLVVGFLAKFLTSRGWSVHGARMAMFVGCVALTALGCVAAYLPASPLLLILLLAVGFGSLGQFPTYYAFTQEISTRGMGKVTGAFSFVAWISVAAVQGPIGRWIDQTGSYAAVTLIAGLTPIAAALALLILWRPAKPARSTSAASAAATPDLEATPS
ncbi:MAG: MFS transporter [Paludisphaera borealis]|uniref:MFS transporter n=1 Tax=Paludisphaera borealis TaxID=1387353 RepID=UPI00284E801D|nr:MFS transporter [Paludisphaera borealis]MDR3620711.1 MFS transporter [Paludisphaera borealis]